MRAAVSARIPRGLCIVYHSPERTLGVPIFQEQLMQVAVAVGGCTADDADLLRRAMGSKRGIEKIEKLNEMQLASIEASFRNQSFSTV